MTPSRSGAERAGEAEDAAAPTMGSAGTLYVVATPIGNLGDLGARAGRVLGSVQRVVAEDTRHTRGLLAHLGIRGKRVDKLDAHAGERALERVVAALQAGESVALVTDAGCPSVSDPGTALVRAVTERGLTVSCVPGPSAVTAAVSVSGLVDAAFAFLGFLPRRGEKRRRAIEDITRRQEAVVLFEAPSRFADTLVDLAQAMPRRPACVARELTKVHEELRHGTLAELAAARQSWRGELVIVLGPAPAPPAPLPDAGAAAEPLDERLEGWIALGLLEGRPTRELAELLAERAGLPRRRVYEQILALQRRCRPT